MTGVCIQQQWPTINLPNETSSSSTTGQADSRRNSKKPSSLYLRMTSSIAKLFSSRRKKAVSEQVGTLMQFYFSFFFEMENGHCIRPHNPALYNHIPQSQVRTILPQEVPAQ